MSSRLKTGNSVRSKETLALTGSTDSSARHPRSNSHGINGLRGGSADTPRKTSAPSALPSSRKERYAAGKALRQRVAREKHGEWTPGRNRSDPVELVIESSKGRIPELIPIRYGRMMVSPFTLYRGTANIMAADLASTPVSGLQAQLCGDAHLLNFGGFDTPERLVLDINDFDETFPCAWEWNLKRLV